jgi:hypothetical protein
MGPQRTVRVGLCLNGEESAGASPDLDLVRISPLLDPGRSERLLG